MLTRSDAPLAPDWPPVRPVAGGVVLHPGDAADWSRIAWWRPDPGLFAVIVHTLGAAFLAGHTVITVDELAPMIGTMIDPHRDGRPILLVASEPPPGWVVQRLADHLDVPVIGGPWRGRWAAMRPSAGSSAPLPRNLGASYPFDRAHLATLALGRTPMPRAGAVLPGHRSTAQERRSFRQRPIPGLPGHLAAAGRLLALQPALRSATEPAEAVEADLAAIRVYLGTHGPELDRALRSPDAGVTQPVAACVTSGLRRLPCHRGVVLRGAEGSGYRPGTVLLEPGYTTAVLDPSTDFGCDTTMLIWSTSGRRTTVVADPGSPERVLFAANTTFAVLDVRQRGNHTFVLMRETPTPANPAADGRAVADSHVGRHAADGAAKDRAAKDHSADSRAGDRGAIDPAILAALERAVVEREAALASRLAPIEAAERYRTPIGLETFV